jgi:hypothetical protein
VAGERAPRKGGGGRLKPMLEISADQGGRLRLGVFQEPGVPSSRDLAELT